MTRKERQGNHCINSGCTILGPPGKLKQQDEETKRQREGGRETRMGGRGRERDGLV